MRKLLVAVVAGVIGVSASTAQADSLKTTGYVGISQADLKQYNPYFADGKKHIKTQTTFIRVGGDINEYFSSELRVGTSTKTKKGPANQGTADSLNINQGEKATYSHFVVASALLKAGYPVGPIKPYVAVGYTFGKEKVSANGKDEKANYDHYTYGAGVDVSLGRRVLLSGEWLQYDNHAGVRVKGPAVGLAVRF